MGWRCALAHGGDVYVSLTKLSGLELTGLVGSLTAKMTAKPADSCGRGWTTADS